jgi:hypothetical protein
MDRVIVYPGGIPLDTDLLNTNRNTMVALHALIAATLGTTTAADGLAVVPTNPASMNVVVSQGSLTTYTALDSVAYGSLPADTTDSIVKMGVLLQPATLPLTAPTTAGTSIAYLVEAAFSESDQDPVVLPYYNAANPAQPYLGPNNTGAAQNTLRAQSVAIQVKAGAAAPTGSQVVPPADPGWTPLAAIQVNAGVSAITAAMIFQAPATRFVPFKLPDLRPGFSQPSVFVASGSFVVPPWVTRARVTVIGGGGAGGTHASLPGGGGGAGGVAIKWLSGLVPNTVIPVTVGQGGAGSGTPGNGAPGQSSSFGSYVSATGGQGGGGGSGSATPIGGQGGSGVGGDVNFSGSWGNDAVPPSGLGGSGGGPGAGKGGTGVIGQNAPTFGVGGGGGGGGASGGVGLAGGSGGGGLVYVEY